MAENKKSSGARIVFTDFIYLQFFFVCFLFFLTVSTVVYIMSFVKGKEILVVWFLL